jgi:hypothetical protein
MKLPPRSLIRLAAVVVSAAVVFGLHAFRPIGQDGHALAGLPPGTATPSAGPASHPAGPAGVAASGSSGAEERLEVPPPPFSEGIFPCSDCHAGMEVNRTRRTLTEFHTEIELRHDEQHRWCLDCHDATQRDSLHLAGGERIPFDESYRLCGQCHGEKLRDWKAGVHGRRSGEWNGHKSYLLCAHCHNPHQPRFHALAPMPPPRPPERPRESEWTAR